MLTREKLHLHFLSISTDLSFAQQKVLASRKELLEYDCRECKGPESSSSGSLLLTSGSKGLPGECYGCASAAIEHCVTLLRALAMVPGTRKQLVEEVTIVYSGTAVSEKCSIKIALVKLSSASRVHGQPLGVFQLMCC